MDINRMQDLNRAYEPLRAHTHAMVKALKNSGFECEWGYFAQHSVRNGSEWFFEHYPIPVITIKNVCEIGFDIPETFIEFKLKRETALAFDFSRLHGFNFDVYGVNDYLNDMYHTGQDIHEIHANIEKSNELEIGISLIFGYLESVENLLQAVYQAKEIVTQRK
jgi:hypothetical protein